MINNLQAFMFVISILSLVGVIIFLGFMVFKLQANYRERELDYVAAIIAKSLPEYAETRKHLSATMKDKLAQLKVENSLAIYNEKLMREEGIPVT